MKNVNVTQILMLPTMSVSYSESIKTNYANFQSASSTHNCDALINLLDGVDFLIEDCETIGQPGCQVSHETQLDIREIDYVCDDK